MQATVKKNITAGVLTAALAAALSMPALGVAASAPAMPVTVHASDAVALSAAAAQDRATVAAQAGIAAERAVAVESAQAQTAQAAAYTARKSSSNSATRAKGNELSRARSILASLKARYPRYLSGVTVTMGSARGYQAISYYTTGKIVVSPTHRASLERILGHEIWHMIDWRDNGRIDWRESVPPANAGSYR